MRTYKKFLESLSEEQRKQVERYTTKFYLYGAFAGLLAAGVVYLLKCVGV